eukprot:TRINITY_DN12377_c4_g1_i2.p1 TRINITY_DN12377_c4_g1~~TRINITY_DN12377_c4_g1_i2.p1  ORF type:complete len:586 (+),score=142.84 TRINITY_DN12377_c4_g1_i2:85-1842(+)
MPFAKMASTTLYAAYDKLNASGTSDAERNAAFQSILDASTSEDMRVRRLTVSFILECGPHQKTLASKAAVAFARLMQDEKEPVRKEAKVGVARLKQESAFVKELLATLLNRVPFENDDMKSAFLTLAKRFTADVFQRSKAILPDAEDNVREALLAILGGLIEELGDGMTAEVEESVSECLLKVLEDVSKEEFEQLMPLLKGLKIYQQPERANEIVEFLYSLSEADSVKLGDEDSVEMFVPCFQQSGELFQRGADATAFLSTIASKLLYDLEQLGKTRTIVVLRGIAEACHSPGLAPEMARTIGPPLYADLMKQLPEPELADDDLLDDDEALATEATPAAKRDKPEPSDFNYSYIECLLAAVYGCISKAASCVTYTEMQNLDSALGLVIARTTPYTKGLENTIKVKQGDKSAEGQAQLKQLRTALVTIHNIRAYRWMIDHMEDAAKAQKIVFSWHPQAQTQPIKMSLPKGGRAASAAAAANVPRVASSSGKKAVRRQGIYQPPSGRYSKNLGKIPEAAVDVSRQTSKPAGKKKAALNVKPQHALTTTALAGNDAVKRRVIKGRGGIGRRGSFKGPPSASRRVVQKK